MLLKLGKEDGALLGDLEGSTLDVGTLLGSKDGCELGLRLGRADGTRLLLGAWLDATLGAREGRLVGVGRKDGKSLGAAEGDRDGSIVGTLDGEVEGFDVGAIQVASNGMHLVLRLDSRTRTPSHWLFL